MESRRVVRASFSQKVRTTLLEDDVDEVEADVRGVTRLLLAFLVSITLAALALAAKTVFG